MPLECQLCQMNSVKKSSTESFREQTGPWNWGMGPTPLRVTGSGNDSPYLKQENVGFVCRRQEIQEIWGKEISYCTSCPYSEGKWIYYLFHRSCQEYIDVQRCTYKL